MIHSDIEVAQGISSSNESTDRYIGHTEKIKTEEAKEVRETGNGGPEKSL